jgi:VanZ family protein
MNCKQIWPYVTLAFALLICFGTLTPVSTPIELVGGDKTYHILAFAALILPSAACKPSKLLLMFPASIVFGLGIEIAQGFVGRSGDIYDLIADVVGLIAGVIIGLALSRLRLIVQK